MQPIYAPVEVVDGGDDGAFGRVVVDIRRNGITTVHVACNFALARLLTTLLCLSFTPDLQDIESRLSRGLRKSPHQDRPSLGKANDHAPKSSHRRVQYRFPRVVRHLQEAGDTARKATIRTLHAEASEVNSSQRRQRRQSLPEKVKMYNHGSQRCTYKGWPGKGEGILKLSS